MFWKSPNLVEELEKEIKREEALKKIVTEVKKNLTLSEIENLENALSRCGFESFEDYIVYIANIFTETRGLRCPECKSLLEYRGCNFYVTLEEHVFNPNREPFLRPVFGCPNNCFGSNSFFNSFGDNYSLDQVYSQNLIYRYALGSFSREAEISTLLTFDYSIKKTWRFLNDLKVEGENDIPPNWTLILYFLKAKILKNYEIARYHLFIRNKY